MHTSGSWIGVVALALLSAACGRFGFAELDAGAPDDVVALDAAAGPDALAVLGPFGHPTVIAELNSTAPDDDPSLTADLLEIYFASERDGSQKIWHATRDSIATTWNLPRPVIELDGPVSENNPKVTPDGLAIYFASRQPPNAGGADLWHSTRPDRGSPWSAPARIDELATAGDEFEPVVGDGERWIYFTSKQTGDSEIWASHRASRDVPFEPPQQVTGLTSPGYDGGLWIDASETTAVFHRSIDGDHDLYESRRTARAAPFPTPTPIVPVNGTTLEQDPWLSPDFTLLVFSSTRTCDGDLYLATREFSVPY